tara:strand:+ start:1282 stop:2304 length:1023 start_codon:yes stop_codon:yes gene_type:complete
MKILVTGAAGFIGFHLCQRLLKEGFSVIGIDNINDYYSVDLKYDRLRQLGIEKSEAKQFHEKVNSLIHKDSFCFYRINLEDREQLPILFKNEKIEIVCNLAAQAGVRYSIENPETYIDSNIVGFLNILECCRHHNIKHLLYASSSSVYGLNKKIPFSTDDPVDHPISIYAASKKANELMAHTYSHLYKLPTTGLRFFTVYGPWGRPDMAVFLFTKAITNNKAINVFNNGNMMRDFTYIDDIIEGIYRIIESEKNEAREQLYKVYNIGNNNTVKLIEFIDEIEKNLNTKAIKNLLPMQPGDVEKTWANVDQLIADYNFQPNTSVKIGIKNFIDWYKKYYKI